LPLGSAGKTPFVAAVETTAEGRPVRVKFSRVANFRRVSIKGWAVRHLRPAGPVYSDGLNAFRGIDDAGCCHRPIVTGSGKKAVRTPAWTWSVSPAARGWMGASNCPGVFSSGRCGD